MLGLKGKSIGVSAHIGGGKSTFVGEAERQLAEHFKVLSESEYVPATLLANFCNNPVENARDFQTHMHAHASIRDKHAWEFVKSTGKQDRVALVERPLCENFVFFEANVRAGRLDDKKYRPNYEALWKDYGKYSPDVIVYLHVSNEHAVERMYRRTEVDHDRECEKQYVVDDYMKLLGEEYYKFVVKHSTRKDLPPVLVVDWNTHIDLSDPAAYSAAVKMVLEKINDYFLGNYKLPNVTITNEPFSLATSTTELNFSNPSETLFTLARGDDVQLYLPIEIKSS
jgi:deoxyadenosine/deoxycytidine kinase